MTFQLRGLAEGVVGYSSIYANSINEILETYPALKGISHKLIFKKDLITGFTACDG